MGKIIKYLKHPKEAIIYLMNTGHFRWINDKTYLKWKYRLITGEKLHLDNPDSMKYSEKLQWLKLYDRNPLYTKLVDKYEVKKYLSNIIDSKYLIKTLGIYDSVDEIDFSKLPKKFVIKCTHDSGSFIVCKDKSKLDIKRVKKAITKFKKRKYFYLHREWPYKNVKPRIIIEEFLENKNHDDLIEYNIFCFNGTPQLIMSCFGDKKKLRYNDFYDMNFKKLNLKCIYATSDIVMPRPKQLDEMLDMAKKISKGIPNLRVDFYLCNGKIYIGELTFFHWAGFTLFEPKEWEFKLGRMLKLPEKK